MDMSQKQQSQTTTTGFMSQGPAAHCLQWQLAYSTGLRSNAPTLQQLGHGPDF